LRTDRIACCWEKGRWKEPGGKKAAAKKAAAKKGGWMSPAAKLYIARKADESIDVEFERRQGSKLLFLFSFRFLFDLLCHGVAPLLKDRTLTGSRFAEKHSML
jgi:hypothetical protein